MTARGSRTSDRLSRATPRLTAVSIAARGSSPRFTWPAAVDPDRLAMSEALLPTAGLAMHRELGDEQRWRLALLEATHFFSLNIAGEHELIAGIAARLDGYPAHVSEYLRHFLHEEQEHTGVFSRFCLEYAGRIFPHGHVRFSQEFLPGEMEFLFFARVLIFEEIAAFYNARVADDAEVWSLSRDINRYHAEDEARHLAFGRLLLEDLWERFRPRWSAEDRERIRRYLARYMHSVALSYVSPDVHRAAGLPSGVRRQILESPHWASLTAQSTARVTRWLARLGVANNV